MKAIRIRAPATGEHEYSPANPAPSSAFELRNDILQPAVTKVGDVLVAIKATTVTRGSLAWPELYAQPVSAEMGNDFSGVIVEVHPDETNFKKGDAVYGMTSAHKGCAWAQYVVADPEELFAKPVGLSWEEAAALPMSAMTADQALFDQAGLELYAEDAKRVLVTGAAGGVGEFVVRFAAAAGHHVIACSSSASRTAQSFADFGAKEALQYDQFSNIPQVDVIVDTVGGQTLEQCWKLVKRGGSLITIETNSWNFVEEHKKFGLTDGREDQINAKFFILEPSRTSMARISNMVVSAGLRGRVACTLPLGDAQAAYDLAESGQAGAGKIVLIV